MKPSEMLLLVFSILRKETLKKAERKKFPILSHFQLQRMQTGKRWKELSPGLKFVLVSVSTTMKASVIPIAHSSWCLSLYFFSYSLMPDQLWWGPGRHKPKTSVLRPMFGGRISIPAKAPEDTSTLVGQKQRLCRSLWLLRLGYWPRHKKTVPTTAAPNFRSII